jgi:biotin carboxyl carrier protein
MIIEHEHFEAVGDVPTLRERLVVSPSTGRFVPLPPGTITDQGEWVTAGQVLARIDVNGDEVPVVSPFSGWLMGTLALPGAPVVSGEAVFWVLSS